MSEKLPNGIRPEHIHQWQCRRFGKQNPSRMDNPLWELLIRTRESAWNARNALGIPPKRGATWCFDRFGQTETELDDGSRILIAGEHEDSYDDDFCIYNDVIVVRPDDSIEIYGYPEELFPPTDFHTATLVEDRIILVGNLGYKETRKPGPTQILSLNIWSFEITVYNSEGAAPGWIHKHETILFPDERLLVVTGGKVLKAGTQVFDSNTRRWGYSLDANRWSLLD